MRRREFLLGASGAAGATMAASPAAAQETATPSPTPTGTETAADGAADSGATVEVRLVDYAYEPGTEEPLVIPPGTTVNFVWETSNHNINVTSQPEDADWPGQMDIENSGFETSHTFEVVGTYEFQCDPHIGLGMEGTIEVEEGAPVPGADGAEAAGAPAEVDPEHMGVPIQAHFVGLATILMIVVSLVFTFFLLKYGETPHSGYPKR